MTNKTKRFSRKSVQKKLWSLHLKGKLGANAYAMIFWELELDK